MGNTTIQDYTGEKLKSFAKRHLGTAGNGLGYDHIIDWLLELGEQRIAEKKK